MSLLTIITNVCHRVGINAPSLVIGTGDDQILQLLALANEEGEELSERYSWSSMQREATFTTLAAQLQGSVETIASIGFQHILNETIWNRTQNRPIYGSLSPQDWQLLVSSNITGPYEEYRIKNGNLYLIPAPTAGETCAFEYISHSYCQTFGGTPQEEWSNDDDIGILDEKLMTAGIVWRWKQVKGLDYAEDFRKYEIRVLQAMGRDAGKPTLRMDGGPMDRMPGIIVPQGSWTP